MYYRAVHAAGLVGSAVITYVLLFGINTVDFFVGDSRREMSSWLFGPTQEATVEFRAESLSEPLEQEGAVWCLESVWKVLFAHCQ